MRLNKTTQTMIALTLSLTVPLMSSGCVDSGNPNVSEKGWQGKAADNGFKPGEPNYQPAPPPPPDLGSTIFLGVLGAAVWFILSKHDHNNTGQNQPPPSDMRLKRDIHLLATLDSGIKIYSFKYLWSDTAYVGVMAQDLLANPAWRGAVVTSPNGFYAVNYGMLGLKMVTLEDWQAQGIASIKGGERMSVTKQLQALQPAL